jgi:hypothetical protein
MVISINNNKDDIGGQSFIRYKDIKYSLLIIIIESHTKRWSVNRELWIKLIIFS